MAKPGLYSSPKFFRLCMTLNMKPYEAVGVLQYMWDQAIMMDTVKLSKADIAYLFHGIDTDLLLSALVDTGFLDLTSDGYYEIHDWSDHFPNWYLRKKGVLKSRSSASTTPKVDRVFKEIDGRTSFHNLPKDDLRSYVYGLEGDVDGIDYYSLIDHYFETKITTDSSLYDLADELKKIQDARYYSESKGIGKIRNEKAYILAWFKTY